MSRVHNAHSTLSLEITTLTWKTLEKCKLSFNWNWQVGSIILYSWWLPDYLFHAHVLSLEKLISIFHHLPKLIMADLTHSVWFLVLFQPMLDWWMAWSPLISQYSDFSMHNSRTYHTCLTDPVYSQHSMGWSLGHASTHGMGFFVLL